MQQGTLDEREKVASDEPLASLSPPAHKRSCLRQPQPLRSALWLDMAASDELAIAREAAARHYDLEVWDCSQSRPIQKSREIAARSAIFFAQPRRGMWRDEDVDAVYEQAPLARLVGVHGSLCEGWQRTGHPLRGVDNLYWSQLPLRLLCWNIAANHAPRTVQRDELLVDRELLEACCYQAKRDCSPRIAISAALSERQALEHALETIQWRPVELPFGAPTSLPQEKFDGADDGFDVDAVVWDGDIRRTSDRERLEACRRCFSAPILATTIAPRVEDWLALRDHCDGVLPKPYSVTDLYGWLLAHVLTDAGPNQTVPHPG